MVTAPQLIAHAANFGITVTQRKIDEWQRANLLPKPTREKLPGQGRVGVPYQYSDEALAVVVWLGTYRRFIGGDDATRFWLWLEGFEFVQLDPAAILRDRIRALWAAIQQKDLPSLPNMETVLQRGLPADVNGQLLEEFEMNVSQPLVQEGAWNDQQTSLASMGATVLGIELPGYDQLRYDSQGDDHETNGSTPASDIAASIFSGIDDQTKHSLVASLPDMVEAIRLIELYRIASSPLFRPEGFPPTWQLFTPDTLPLLWPAFEKIALFRTQGTDRPKDRGDLMRILRYDPVNFLALGVAFMKAGELLGTLFSQEAAEVPKEEVTASSSL